MKKTLRQIVHEAVREARTVAVVTNGWDGTQRRNATIVRQTNSSLTLEMDGETFEFEKRAGQRDPNEWVEINGEFTVKFVSGGE